LAPQVTGRAPPRQALCLYPVRKSDQFIAEIKVDFLVKVQAASRFFLTGEQNRGGDALQCARSKRAIRVNIEIMRAFVRLRRILASMLDLARKLKLGKEI